MGKKAARRRDEQQASVDHRANKPATPIAISNIPHNSNAIIPGVMCEVVCGMSH
jgi:hypothetical protein